MVEPMRRVASCLGIAEIPLQTELLADAVVYKCISAIRHASQCVGCLANHLPVITQRVCFAQLPLTSQFRLRVLASEKQSLHRFGVAGKGGRSFETF